MNLKMIKAFHNPDNLVCINKSKQSIFSLKYEVAIKLYIIKKEEWMTKCFRILLYLN